MAVYFDIILVPSRTPDIYIFDENWDAIGGAIAGSVISGTNIWYRFDLDSLDLDDGSYHFETQDPYAAGDLIIRDGQVVSETYVNVVAISGTAPDRGSETTIRCFYAETVDVAVTTDTDLTAVSCRIAIEDMQTRTDVLVVENASLTKTSTTVTFTVTTAVTNKMGQYVWSLRKTSDNTVLMRGVLECTYAAKKDT